MMLLLSIWLSLMLFASANGFSASSPAGTAATSSSISTNSPPTTPKAIPITVLSGFLGSGKTTLLQNMLQNKEGLRIAVIVNDVASVNIDSKLVKKQSTGSAAVGDDNNDNNVVVDGIVELQNGCACCSLSDELLASVSELVTMSDIRGESDKFDHIVIELSGVADPKQIRAKFQEAELMNMPILDRVQLDTFVTVIDSAMYQKYFESDQLTSRSNTPELYYRQGEKEEEEKRLKEIKAKEEEWMKDLPPKLYEAVMVGIESQERNGRPDEDEGNGVSDLLVSQTETADLVVLNKIDILTEETATNNENMENNNSIVLQKLEQLREIIFALNPKAKVTSTSYGNVPISSVLAIAGGKGVVQAGVVDDHRDAVQAAEGILSMNYAEEEKSTTTSVVCTDPDCIDDSHSHSHEHTMQSSSSSSSSHEHSHEHKQQNEHESIDTSHSHEHSHHTDDTGCTDPDCTDTSHSHSHSHSHSSSSATGCTDPDCTDTSHSHTHHHSSTAGSSLHAGIGSFVYKARRPFHPGRLITFLRNLPIVRGIPSVEDVNAVTKNGTNNDDNIDDDSSLDISKEIMDILRSTLRSKGFLWCADSHRRAMYWSHAGSSIEISCVGQWWATLPREQWPDDAIEYVLQDFDNKDHIDAAFINIAKEEIDDDDETTTNNNDNNLLPSVGDRRQEVVFIGPKFGTSKYEKLICDSLDNCLLQDDEWSDYQSIVLSKSKTNNDEVELGKRFLNPMEIKVSTY